jgi:hypothetical protein
MLSEHACRARPSGSGGTIDRRARRRRWATLGGVLAAALALMAFVASAAQAEEPHDTIEWGCKAVTINYAGFPSGEAVTVKEKVRVATEKSKSVYWFKTFKFTGPTGSDTVPIQAPPGHDKMDVFAKWKTATFHGGSDQFLGGGIDCPYDPKYTVIKKQRRGGTGGYSTETIPNGKVGEKVEYGIVVTNTGNVPLKLSNFSDPNCDEGTITGGPGENAIPIGGFSNFFCSHTLTEADHVAGSRCNIASVTATPTEGPEESINQESNEACTELPTPKDIVEFQCKGITFHFEGFPNMPKNTVKLKIRVDGVQYGPIIFEFNGPTGEYTWPLNLGPGKHALDGKANWKTNGFSGGSDQSKAIACTAEPDFSIEKTQRVQGSGNPFTNEYVSVKGGQTMEYQITIANTGNVGLKFPFFEDFFRELKESGETPDFAFCTESECSAGTLKCSGGPGAAEVKPGATTQYACERTVDAEVGGEKVEEVVNRAFAEADPTEGSEFERSSNSVFATVE